MKLIDRLLVREFLKIFIPFLLGIYILFALIDYSTHAQELVRASRLSLPSVFLYYAFQLLKQCHILIPLATLIALIKVLTSMNVHHELLALFSGGFSRYRLLSPFLILTLLLGSGILINFEWGVPKAESFILSFQSKYFHLRSKNKKSPKIKTFYLEDKTKMIAFSNKEHYLEDVYWIINSDDLWHFKSVDLKEGVGFLGDHMKRSLGGTLDLIESHPRLSLPAYSGQKKQGSSDPSTLSLSQLVALKEQTTSRDMRNGALTQLYFKGMTSLFPLLILTALFPFCLIYRRQFSLFLLYAAALFCFVIFYTVIDSLVIAGENGLISPSLALLTVPIATLLFSVSRLVHGK